MRHTFHMYLEKKGFLKLHSSFVNVSYCYISSYSTTFLYSVTVTIIPSFLNLRFYSCAVSPAAGVPGPLASVDSAAVAFASASPGNIGLATVLPASDSGSP